MIGFKVQQYVVNSGEDTKLRELAHDVNFRRKF